MGYGPCDAQLLQRHCAITQVGNPVEAGKRRALLEEARGRLAAVTAEVEAAAGGGEDSAAVQQELGVWVQLLEEPAAEVVKRWRKAERLPSQLPHADVLLAVVAVARVLEAADLTPSKETTGRAYDVIPEVAKRFADRAHAALESLREGGRDAGLLELGKPAGGVKLSDAEGCVLGGAFRLLTLTVELIVSR